MGREIKFRGFGISDKKWHYGFLTIQQSGKCIIGGFEVYAESIGQYTGLYDKNGIEIFDGDIVGCEKRGDAFWRSVVIYNEQKARFDVIAMEISFPMILDECDGDIAINGTDYEVIGNIHETSELLAR